MKNPSTFWKILTAIIAVFIGSVFIDSWILEPQRIDHVCSEINVGTPTSEVFVRAKEYNVRVTESRPEDKDIKYITLHGGSFSRYVCEITHDGGHVINREFKKANVR